MCNMFMRKPKKEHKDKKICSCQHEREKKKEPKKKSLEKITTINNIRIV